MYRPIQTFIFLLLSSTVMLSPANAKQSKQPGYENTEFAISVFPRTINQTIAFYTGRGFPKAALNEFKSMCFVTIGIRNKSSNRVWFDLDNWHFKTAGGEIKRRLRPEWTQRWNEIGLEKRFQSTFRWTLIPEKMGLYDHEGEGGNVTLIHTDKPITITGVIFTGENKSKRYPVTIKNVLCARDK